MTIDQTSEVASSNNDSYTFVLPDYFIGHYISGTGFIESGQAIQFSGSCNPDFEDADGINCTQIYVHHKCYAEYDLGLLGLIYYGGKNEKGITETALQCPECGCGADGAINFNDLAVIWEEYMINNPYYLV